MEWYIFIASLLIYLCVISIILHNNNISIDNAFLKIASLILFILELFLLEQIRSNMYMLSFRYNIYL